MTSFVKLYSKKKGEINLFLSKFYNSTFNIPFDLNWYKEYENPVELCDLIGVYIDNIDSFKISMWICIDKDAFININENNGNKIIKYLYERYPY